MKINRTQLVVLTAAIVIILDQILKIWVKTNMHYGDEFNILGLDWARIHFVENKGMAFGFSFGGDWGKIALSLFRIFAVIFLIYVIKGLIKNKESKGVLVCFALILAGAIGNIIDSAFYGLIFSESPYHGGLAQAFPEGGGYGKFLMGKVVDMFYFPMLDTTWPSWMPWKGGEPLRFFRPVFNLADSAITVGILSILLFFRSFFKAQVEPNDDDATIASSGEEEE